MLSRVIESLEKSFFHEDFCVTRSFQTYVWKLSENYDGNVLLLGCISNYYGQLKDDDFSQPKISGLLGHDGLLRLALDSQ